MAGNGSISIDGYPGILRSRKIFIHINTAISIVKTFQLGSHPPRREFLALLVACIILVPSLLVFTPSTRGSVAPYSFRDDFNYTSISQLQAAGWSINSQAPSSSYTIASGALTLLYNGSGGGAVRWRGAPRGTTKWGGSLRGPGVGNP